MRRIRRPLFMAAVITAAFVTASIFPAGRSRLASYTAAATAIPGQQAQQQSTPTLASIVDRNISAVEKQIVDVAEAMPEDKFNFSPASLNIPGSDFKGVRTFAVQLKHVATSNYYIWSHITGDKLPDGLGDDGNGPVNLKSKAEIIKFLKDSFALGHKAAATLTTQNMLQPAQNSKSASLQLAEFGVAHANDHYGQMVEYLRMKGIVPPASRGNSD
jgi:DinB superfamily